MFFHIIFLTSCSPVNKTTQSQKTSDENQNVQKNILIENKTVDNNVLLENKIVNKKSELSNNITVLLSKNNNDYFADQLTNILELGVYDKNLEFVNFDIKSYDNNEELKKILKENNEEGKIYIGPISSQDTSVVENFCHKQIIFFSFSSDTNLARNCIYLINFFLKMNWKNYLNI